MEYLLGIDFGGGSSKATLTDREGNIMAQSTAEYPTYHPEDGACEQRPADWIEALIKNTNSILEKSGAAASSIAAVAIDSATHTAVLCDKDMRAIRDAIHWTDSRSAAEADELNRMYGDALFSKTYHRADTIWTLPELMWLRNREPEVFSKCRHILFEKDYIRYFLTGEIYTDKIEAAGSMLCDMRTSAWDGELCSVLNILPELLPEIIEPADIAGYITAAAAEATGLSVGTPVICGTTDTAIEVFAAGACEIGDMTVKLATAGRICVITDRAYPDRHLVNYPHIQKGLWYPGTATKAAASALRWYRDSFGGDYSLFDAEAETLPLGSDGLFFHPYINGELTPYADPTLAGSFTGIRSTHSKAHFTRAVLEGVSFSLLDSIRYLESKNIEKKPFATLIGGGAKSRLWAGITADMLGITLRMTDGCDSSLGSAMLAGVSAKIFESPSDAVKKCVRERCRIAPDPERTEKYARLFSEYGDIATALKTVYNKYNKTNK